jgi:twitching motility protein PilT
VPPAPRRKRRVSADTGPCAVARGVGAPVSDRRIGRASARPRARDGPDGQREIHDARRHRRSHQQHEAGSNPHQRGPQRICALREDPDVVLVGEMRDTETMAAALKLAETGHLTLATLHTNSAAQTITRIVDAFPAHQQSQIRVQLSLVLEGIVCQALVPNASGAGRTPALEVLVASSAIRNLIREDKVHQLYGAMQVGQDKAGMQTMNQSLAKLVERRVIAKESALWTSPARDELAMMLEKREGIGVSAGLRR